MSKEAQDHINSFKKSLNMSFMTLSTLRDPYGKEKLTALEKA
jgi:hypothetical protein